MDTAFGADRLINLLTSAVAVGGLVWLARFVARYVLKSPLSQKEVLLLGGGLIAFIMLTNVVHDPQTAIAYCSIILAGYLASRFASRLIR